jgi:hypothetical protein
MSIPMVSVIVLSLLVGCAGAEEAAPPSEASVAELRLGDLQNTVNTLHEKFTALAVVIPEEDLTWRPMDGVRSVSEVYIHVAADNFFVPVMMGWEAPGETGVTSDVATFRAYQERSMSRDEMVEAVDASFEFLLSSLEESGDDLNREVVLGTPTTVGDVWIRAVVHLHEHLGQSIAYARANEVVPPWSG